MTKRIKQYGTRKVFKVFHRTWWKANPSWPDGREPCIGKSITVGWAETEDQARAMCAAWNADHKPGKYSDKAEYTSDW